MKKEDQRKLEEWGFTEKVIGSDPGIVVWCRTAGTPSEEEGTYVDLGGDLFDFGAWSETQDIAEALAEIWLPCLQTMKKFLNERAVKPGEITFETEP